MIGEDDLRAKVLELLVETGGCDVAGLEEQIPKKQRGHREVYGILEHLERKGMARKVVVFQLTKEGVELAASVLRVRAAFPGKGNHTRLNQRLAKVMANGDAAPEPSTET